LTSFAKFGTKLAPSIAFDKGLNGTPSLAFKYGEFVDFAQVARALGGDKPSPLDIYISYEVASGEGFHVFGIDSFNDIIATEAGRLFAKRFSDDASYSIGSFGQLQLAILDCFRDARKSFLEHPVMKKRADVVTSFYSLMLTATEKGRFYKIQIKFPIAGWPGDPSFPTIWKATIGTILQQNEGCLTTDSDAALFLSQLRNHIETARWDANFIKDGVKMYLWDDDTQALHQMVEMLSLINEPRDGE